MLDITAPEQLVLELIPVEGPKGPNNKSFTPSEGYLQRTCIPTGIGKAQVQWIPGLLHGFHTCHPFGPFDEFVDTIIRGKSYCDGAKSGLYNSV